MSYVKDTDIFDATNGGLDIITSYYPNAIKVITKTTKQFKIRESEKTASASLKQLESGIWVVTDFGGDNKPRNGIQVCQLEENISFGEACAVLGSRFGVKGAVLQVYKPIVEKRSLTANEVPNSYSFQYNETFSEKELALLGPRVSEKNCTDFKFYSCKSFTHYKDNGAVVTTATDEYPIFVFDFGTWQKIYQPNSFDKNYRFRYAGDKPKKHVFGMDLVKAQFEANKKKEDENQGDLSISDESDNGDAPKRKSDPRVDAVFIMSGGSDGLNLYSFNKFPIWFNSESEHLDWAEYTLLKTYAKEIYYVADLDSTGVKQATALGLKFLDIKLLWLPERLKMFNDKRGNPCKDFKDFVDKFYKPKASRSFVGSLDKLIANALPLQFWTEAWSPKTKKMAYNLSNTRLYQFLNLMGFGRYEALSTKEGYVYIKKEGSIVSKMLPNDIENYVHSFLEERQYHPDLRDYIYNCPKLNERSLSKLPKIEIDFKSAGKDYQYFFFKNKILKITANEIQEYKHGEVDNYIWEEKIIDFKIKKTEPNFEIKILSDNYFDIKILNDKNPYLNFLINTSRVHWRKELEEFFEKKSEKEALAYYLKNKFNIAGDNLSEDEIYEQKLHLINKIFCIGYLLHNHKNESKPWLVFGMDNKISETGESHGGSGKSLALGTLNYIAKNRVYIKGRDPEITKDKFIYSEVNKDTDFILIDDANQYLDFNFFYSEITGSLRVNPKNTGSFEIPFEHSPKFIITSNFTPSNNDTSTGRRLLFTSFSDFYHENTNNEYRETKTVTSDFEGRNLFSGFTETEWNDYYNVCAQCVQFYLSYSGKIDPPMDNVKKRSLRAIMGEVFESWANTFFSMRDLDPSTFEELGFKHLDNYVVKDVAFEDFKKKPGTNLWSIVKFKKALKAFCQYNGYTFCPKDLQNDKSGRIIKKEGGVAMENIYIRTIQTDITTSADVKEYENEDEIFKDEK